MTRTRTTTVATTALLILAASLTACSGGSSGPDLSAADDTACTTLAALSDDDGAIDKWEQVYRTLSASDSADLRDVAQSVLTSRVSHTDALRFRDRALALCSTAGWTATTAGQGD